MECRSVPRSPEPRPHAPMSLPLDEDTVPPDLDPREDGTGTNPPRRFAETLRQLGPGLIIAGSIVGSGELIATTKTGAQGGITLLWLIIVGCVIKVFVQIELGRHAITHGQTTLAALNTLPGPRKRVSWILWFWLAMMACTVGQLGGIVGGVGQALAISCPITGDYLDAIRIPAQGDLERFLDWEAARLEGTEQWTSLTREDQERISAGQELMATRLLELGERGDSTLQTVRQGGKLVEPVTVDDRYWATAAALVTVALLYNGRYGLIQNFSTALVVTFTFITLGNVLSLQATPQWRIPLEEWLQGLMFRLPKSSGGPSPLVTALATFGIIGVGATELIQYPYWCIEKGYAKYTGRRSNSDEWAMRSAGLDARDEDRRLCVDGDLHRRHTGVLRHGSRCVAPQGTGS